MRGLPRGSPAATQRALTALCMDCSKLKPQPQGLQPSDLCALVSHLHSFVSAFCSAFTQTNLRPSREGTSLAGKFNCGKFAIKVNLPCTFVLRCAARDWTFISSS